MRKINALLLLLLTVSMCFGQLTPSTGANTYYGSNQYLTDINGLPAITGKWYFVDPYAGSNTNDGRSKGTAFKNLDTAYARCTDLAGDGICFLSPRVTSAMTTSYMTVPLVWAKSGITVFGVCSPTREFVRGRVSNLEVTTGSVATLSFVDDGSADYILTTAQNFITLGFAVGQKLRVTTTSTTNQGTSWVVSKVTATKLYVGASSVTTLAAAASATVENYMDYVVNITGSNNAFYNIQFNNSDADALALGGVIVTGHRNYFQNCDIMGANGAAAAVSASGYSLQLVGAQDNTFANCTVGNDMTDRANHASCEILFTVNSTGAVPCERDRFIGCETQAYVSTGTAHGAIASSDAGAIRRDIIFKDCVFRCDPTACATVFIGTATTLGKIYMINSYALNYTNWDDGSANIVRASAPACASTGAGGLVVVGTER